MRRLGRLAEGLLEAGWLATVILVPLALDKNRSANFEDAKADVLRSIAIVMLVAWATKALASPAEVATPAAQPASLLARLMRVPLLVPVALVLATTLLATALSLSPSESFWGHAGRAQGALTLLAQVAIFAAALANLCSARQVRRLITALILPTVPIAAYALFQRLQLEPLQVTARETDIQRVTSLLGQPVFLAAYLGMVMPFTVLRLHEARRLHAVPRWQRLLSVALFAGLLLLQGIALLLSESRGPLLGLVSAGAVGFLTVAARRSMRRTVLAVGALGAVSVLLLALVAPRLQQSAEPGSERARIALRASELFDTRGGGGQFRTTNWIVAERVLRNRAPLELADGSHDPHPGLRPLVGYGPELQYAVSPPFYDAELTQLFGYFLTDRYHHDLWDALITTGALGLTAWLALQSVVLWLALRSVQLLATPQRARVFWAAYAGGAALGALGWTLLRGLPYVFLGLQAGAVLGLGAFLALLAVGPRGPAEQGREAPAAVPFEGVHVAALAALVGHAIETSFSFTVTSTGLLFWLLCALVVACGRLPLDAEPASEALSNGARSARTEATAAAVPWADHVASGALLALTVTALGFVFLGGFTLPREPAMVLWQGLTHLTRPAGAHYPVVAILVAATLLCGTLMLALEPLARGGAARLGLRVRGTLGVGALLSLVYWLWQAHLLAQRGVPVSSRALIVARNIALHGEGLTTFYVYALLVMLLFALTHAHLTQTAGVRAPLPVPWWRGVAAGGCALLGLSLLGLCVLRPASADAALAVGNALKDKEPALAEEAFRHATELRPEVDIYQAALAKAYSRHARSEPARAAALYQLADQSMRAAIAKNPIVGEHATNLAVNRGNWALHSTGAARAELASSVPTLYARALSLSPQDPSVWQLWGMVQLNLLHDAPAALTSARRALVLAPKNAAAHGLLADCQLILARSQAGEARREHLLAAAASFAQAAMLAPRQPHYRLAEGKAYLEAGEPAKATATLRAALSATPAASPARKGIVAALRNAESAVALVARPELSP